MLNLIKMPFLTMHLNVDGVSSSLSYLTERVIRGGIHTAVVTRVFLFNISKEEGFSNEVNAAGHCPADLPDSI